MRRCAEAVDAEAAGVARHAQCAIADQARAQQRRRVRVIDDRRQAKAVARVGHRVLGVAAVTRVAGEGRRSRTGSRARRRSRGRRRRSRRARARRRARPASNCVTPAPRSTTTPTISWPGTSGSVGSVSSPSTMCRSVRHTPQACTRSRISPGPGRGTVRSSRTQGPSLAPSAPSRASEAGRGDVMRRAASSGVVGHRRHDAQAGTLRTPCQPEQRLVLRHQPVGTRRVREVEELLVVRVAAGQWRTEDASRPVWRARASAAGSRSARPRRPSVPGDRAHRKARRHRRRCAARGRGALRPRRAAAPRPNPRTPRSRAVRWYRSPRSERSASSLRVERVPCQLLERDEFERLLVRGGQVPPAVRRPASSASRQRAAHRHQRSPACRPGNWYSGCGVVRSLPRPAEKSRNSALTRAHTVCEPTSCGPVWQ